MTLSYRDHRNPKERPMALGSNHEPTYHTINITLTNLRLLQAGDCTTPQWSQTTGNAIYKHSAFRSVADSRIPTSAVPTTRQTAQITACAPTHTQPRPSRCQCKYHHHCPTPEVTPWAQTEDYSPGSLPVVNPQEEKELSKKFWHFVEADDSILAPGSNHEAVVPL